MKCPYSLNVQRVNQWAYEYDDEGRGSFTELIEREGVSFVDCLREECGAFYEGRCHFQG